MLSWLVLRKKFIGRNKQQKKRYIHTHTHTEKKNKNPNMNFISSRKPAPSPPPLLFLFFGCFYFWLEHNLICPSFGIYLILSLIKIFKKISKKNNKKKVKKISLSFGSLCMYVIYMKKSCLRVLRFWG